MVHLTDAQVQAVLNWMLGGQIGPSPILSLLRNVDTFTVANTLPNFQTQFLGFICTDPFNSITLTVPTDASWVVSDFTTAQALTSAVPEPLHMGDDDPWLRRRWLHGVSSEVAANIDGRLICDHRI
jgi:hypothetical protein